MPFAERPGQARVATLGGRPSCSAARRTPPRTPCWTWRIRTLPAAYCLARRECHGNAGYAVKFRRPARLRPSICPGGGPFPGAHIACGPRHRSRTTEPRLQWATRRATGPSACDCARRSMLVTAGFAFCERAARCAPGRCLLQPACAVHRGARRSRPRSRRRAPSIGMQGADWEIGHFARRTGCPPLGRETASSGTRPQPFRLGLGPPAPGSLGAGWPPARAPPAMLRIIRRSTCATFALARRPRR